MVEVREVRTKGELRRFVNYVNVLYKDVPQFIPAMYGDDLDDWKGKFDFLKDKCEVVYLPRTPEISTTKIKTDLHT